MKRDSAKLLICLMIIGILVFRIVFRTQISFYKYYRFMNVFSGAKKGTLTNTIQHYGCGDMICPLARCETNNQSRCAVYSSLQQCKIQCKKYKYSKNPIILTKNKNDFQHGVYYCPVQSNSALLFVNIIQVVILIMVMVMLLCPIILRKVKYRQSKDQISRNQTIFHPDIQMQQNF